jgi:DNA polymerase III epsilon subunit-like protein
MTVNSKPLICFDFETGGLDTATCEVLQVACVAVDPRSLEIIPGSEFNSYIKPLDRANVDAGALKVNKITDEIMEAAPPLDVVWPQFAAHVLRFNPKGKSEFTAPIPAGKNIRSFDLPILQRLCEKYKFVDKRGRQHLFSNRTVVDLEDVLFHWFESCGELGSYKMDDVRDYFGMSSEKAHDALQDVLDTANIITRFMKYQRTVGAHGSKFRGAFAAAA